MLPRFAQSLWMFSILLANVASGQLADEPIEPFRSYGDTVAVKYRVGLSVEATRGAIRDALGTVAVPLECDEQEVVVVDEDISPEVERVQYRILDGGVRQMLVTIPQLPDGAEAHAFLTFEVRTKVIKPINEELTAQLVKPKKPDRDMKRYLGMSPYIQAKNGKIRRTLKDVFSQRVEKEPSDGVELTSTDEDDKTEVENELRAWERVQKIYDFVQGHVKYQEGEDQSALEVLESAQGDCHDISALFVALCRADKIPARMVWVHEHQYPEFCLADSEGNLHWFPCESAGMRAFGEMPTPRVIMQKGENFRDPERSENLRYASEYFIALPVGNAGKPRVKFVREML